MSKRNFYFGGFSLLVAGAAIAGGAAVSSSAMADGGAPADDLNTVSVISMSTDGEAIECTYDGLDFPSFVVGDGSGDGVIAVTGTATIDGSLPVGSLPVDMVPAEALPVGEGQSFSVSVGTDGVVTDSEGNVIEPGTLVGEGGAISVDAELVPLTPEQMEEMNVQIISADDARPGTPEECAAMQPVPAVPATQEG